MSWYDYGASVVRAAGELCVRHTAAGGLINKAPPARASGTLLWPTFYLLKAKPTRVQEGRMQLNDATSF